MTTLTDTRLAQEQIANYHRDGFLAGRSILLSLVAKRVRAPAERYV